MKEKPWMNQGFPYISHLLLFANPFLHHLSFCNSFLHYDLPAVVAHLQDVPPTSNALVRNGNVPAVHTRMVHDNALHIIEGHIMLLLQ